MYSISSNNGRRASDTGPARPELPILFHLADVSRPRFAEQPNVVTPPASSEPVPAAAVTLAQPPVLLATTEKKPLTPAAAAQPAAATPMQAQLVPSPASAPSPFAQTNATPHTVTPQSATESPVATEQPKVTLKSSTIDRRKKKRTPGSEDWFASHGKFIALAFVVALIGTVYLARANRTKAAPANTQTANTSPLIEIATVSKDSPVADAPAVAIASDSTVDLQPPTAPPLLTGANGGEKASSDKLFNFASAKKAEEHVATRPSSPTTEQGLAGESAREASRTTSNAESSDNYPVLAPAYPVTTGGAANYPTAASAPAAYPQTRTPAITGLTNRGASPAPHGPIAVAGNAGTGYQGQGDASPGYGNQYPAQPHMTPPSGWSPPNATAPGQYQPYDNTARGPRYERTGSGPY